MVWKKYEFQYINRSFGWEITMIVFTVITELGRQRLGTRGNKTGQLMFMLISIGLAIPTITAFSYFLRLQSYVVQLDIVLNTIAISFTAFETLLALIWITSGYSKNLRFDYKFEFNTPSFGTLNNGRQAATTFMSRIQEIRSRREEGTPNVGQKNNLEESKEDVSYQGFGEETKEESKE